MSKCLFISPLFDSNQLLLLLLLLLSHHAEHLDFTCVSNIIEMLNTSCLFLVIHLERVLRNY